MNPLQQAIRRLADGESLSSAEAADAFDIVMAGDASAVQVAALLTALRVKGETAHEIAGAARALRRAMRPVTLEAVEEVVDTCGTGGGAVGTLNVSTGAAFIVAGAGVPVAKHGNRAITSRSGSADLVEALGIPLDPGPEAVATAIREASARPSDLPARYGGEEFVLVLPNTSPGGARLLAEKLRQTVAALKIPHNTPAEGSSLTISIGLATMVPQAGSDCRLLISAADRGLYLAKNNGRNQVGIE